MKIVNSSNGKGHLMVWLGVFVLAVAALVAGWYVRLTLNRPAPSVAPAPVRAKIQLPPAVASVPQQVEGAMPSNKDAGPPSGVNPKPVAASAEPAAGSPIAQLPNPPSRKISLPQPTAKAGESNTTAAMPPETKRPAQPEQRPGAEDESRPAVPTPEQPVEMHAQAHSAPRIIKPETARPFTIQVGAFHTKAYADKRMNVLSGKGYDAYVSVTTDAQQRTLYLVRVGHYETREKALDDLAVFKEKEKTAAIVTRAASR